MTLEGTIVNGHVRLDAPSGLPEGTRVRLVAEDDNWDEAWDNMPPPPATETREEFLQSLRDSIAESKAGIGGVDARQFMKELAIKHGLPLMPGSDEAHGVALVRFLLYSALGRSRRGAL